MIRETGFDALMELDPNLIMIDQLPLVDCHMFTAIGFLEIFVHGSKGGDLSFAGIDGGKRWFERGEVWSTSSAMIVSISCSLSRAYHSTR